MSNQFLHIIESASANKQMFDSSMEKLRNTLDNSIQAMKVPAPEIYSTKAIKQEEAKSSKYATGWLKGSLSYPWVVVCIIIPAIFDVLV